MRRPRRTSSGRPYVLAPDQHALIDRVASSLPAPLRNSFRLRVSSSLRLAANVGGVSPELLHRAIDRALAEVNTLDNSA